MRIISHRGLWDKSVKENSFYALKNSLLEGFSVETDIRLTKDNILVISHDSDMKNLFNEDKIIINENYDNLTNLCTFDKFLEEIKANNVNLNAFHIKNIDEKNVLEKTCKKIEELGVQDNCFLFGNDEQSIPLIEECAKKFPTIKTAIHVSKKDFRREILLNTNIVWIDEPEGEWVTKDFIDEMHDLNKICFIISPEVINPKSSYELVEKRWKEWIKMDMDGICTDIPKKLYSLLKI